MTRIHTMYLILIKCSNRAIKDAALDPLVTSVLTSKELKTQKISEAESSHSDMMMK